MALTAQKADEKLASVEDELRKVDAQDRQPLVNAHATLAELREDLANSESDNRTAPRSDDRQPDSNDQRDRDREQGR